MQQGTPYNLLLNEQVILRQDTDTAHPQTPVPIYYIHSIRTPFCKNGFCACQVGKREVMQLYRGILESDVVLQPAAVFTDQGRDAAMSSTTETQPTRTEIHVSLIPGVPESCQLYGHSWEITEHRDVKECTLCHVRGYCPHCTPVAPAEAQPFYCTHHTQLREV